MDSEKKLIKSINIEISNQQIKLGDYDINFVIAGSGNPLILVHGANIGWGQWYKNISELAKYYRVLALDLPGSGGSTKIDFHNSAIDKIFTSTLDLFIEYHNLYKPILVGHGSGAWVCLQTALKGINQLEKMILVDPVGFSKSVPFQQLPITLYPFAVLLSKTLMYPNKKNIYKFLTSVVFNKDSLESDFVDYVYESINREKITHPFMLFNRISSFNGVNKEFVMIDQLPNLMVKTLIILGEKDKVISTNDVKNNASLIPGIKLEIIKGVGHIPPLENSRTFNEVCLNFLQS